MQAPTDKAGEPGTAIALELQLGVARPLSGWKTPTRFGMDTLSALAPPPGKRMGCDVTGERGCGSKTVKRPGWIGGVFSRVVR